MSAAAEFLAHVRNRDDADLLRIALAKEGDRSAGNRVVDFHHLRLHGQVSEDHAVDSLFDLLDFYVRQWCEVRIIEAKPIRGDKRAGLLDVRSQDLAQYRLKN